MKRFFYTGIFAAFMLLSGSFKVHAQYSITTHTTSFYLDTICSAPQIYLQTNVYNSGMRIASYYGDGSSSLDTVNSGGGYGFLYIYHPYASAGTYTIKHVLLIGTAPVDSVTEVFNYQYCNTFIINAYNDLNNNCVFDSSTESYVTIPLTIEIDSAGTVLDTLVTTSGLYYAAHGTPGTVYTFKVLSATPGATVSCPVSGIITDTIQSVVNAYITKSFAVVCSGASGFDLAEYVGEIAGRHHSQIDINVSNFYCTAQNATLTMHFSPKYNFTGAYPTPTSVSGTTVVWSLPNVSQLNPYYISVGLDVGSTWLLVGDTVHTDFTLTPTSGDLDPTNNYISRVDTVTGSFDPNGKAVAPQGNILAGTKLTYTINFENTGNDTAFNIHVMDTLSDNLDISTLKIVTASAPMNISKLNDGTHNIVKFDFPNINLLDSTHAQQNTGMFVFTINAKSGLPDGTVIDNEAGIYFDYNSVVMTNSVENKIGTPAAVAVMSNVNRVEIYPNPVSHDLTVKTGSGMYNTMSITNTIGQVMMRQQLTGAQTSVNVSALPSGIYFITLRGDSGIKTRKFEKL